ncbi:unnamed protein product [Lymnaea stagnalis]|uniref:Uncharacterized protein n=1 Tax=Lymnaea stagnalis TaxID=6523 RepID=A0AAV2HAF9_LYMST
MDGPGITLLASIMVLLCPPTAPQGYIPPNYAPPQNYNLPRNSYPPPPTNFYPPPPPANYFPLPPNQGGAHPFPNMVNGPLPPLPPIGPSPDINNPMPAEAVGAGSFHGFGTSPMEAEVEAGVDPNAGGGGGGAAISQPTSLLSSQGGQHQPASLLDAYYGTRPGTSSGGDNAFGGAAGNLFGAYMMNEYIF